MADDPRPEPDSLSIEEANRLEAEREIWPGERMELADVGRYARETEHTCHGRAPGDAVTQADVLADVGAPTSSLAFNANLRANGFVPADRITPENAADLELRYVVETDTVGLQTSPMIVPSGEGEPPVMYLTQGNQVARAVNARTGELYWEYRYALRRQCSWTGRNRGVGVWGDAVFLASQDTHLVKLDRYTGEERWVVDYLADSQTALDRYDERVSCTQAPLVYDGTVLLGQSGDRLGHTCIQGIDAETGAVEWQHPVGQPEGWLGDTWRVLSSGGAWMGASVDPELDLAFFGTGNAMPFATAPARPGPNKHANSIIAVDLQTGEIAWTHQLFPQEQWDYDTHTLPYVFEMVVDGETRRVVGHDSKAGWTYVLDAETGRLVRRTEPWEIQEHRFGDWPDSRFLNYIGVGREGGGLCAPSAAGATQWPGDAYSPQTGLRYISTMGGGSGFYRTEWEFDPDELGLFQDYGAFPVEADIPDANRIIALDPKSGRVVWEHEVVGALNGPGNVATAGGVVFGGAPGRGDWGRGVDMDVAAPGAKALALNAETGERLWSDAYEKRLYVTPVVWDDPEIDTQFLAYPVNDRILVYGLTAER